jgi:fructose-1-phosphate kinase PfkB-like protein
MKKNSLKILVGFDGFVDSLFSCVKKRFSPERFQQIPTISEFSEIIRGAASQSINIECVLQEKTLGGNAPLLAQALASLGQEVHLVGCCGKSTTSSLFLPLEEYGCHITTFAEPGETHALEFKDGKLLLGNMNELSSITLKNCLSKVSSAHLKSLVREASVIATVNWTMMPLVSEFWEWLLKNPNLLRSTPKKILFVDLADPKKRTLLDLKKALSQLSQLQKHVRVVLGLNRSESHQVCHALKITPPPSLEETANKIISTLPIDTVVIHTHEIVAAASDTSCSIGVPFCSHPLRSTGAGDVFNAGFLHGLLLQKPLFECLQIAIATSGIWVRTNKPPTLISIREFS